MADYTSSYNAKWSVWEVDPDTWDNDDELTGVTSVTINRDCTDSVPLLESATLTIASGSIDRIDEGWYRVMADITQAGVTYRFPIATLMLQKTDFSYSGGVYSQTINGTSVLQMLEDKKNIGNYYKYAPKGVPGAQWIANLFDDVLVPFGVTVEDEDFYLKENFVFSPGDSYLSMAWAILDKYKWCMTIDGDGSVSIKKRPEEPEFVIDSDSMNYLKPEFSSSFDYSQIYNRYYAVGKDGSVMIAENDEPGSFLSRSSRGRWIEYVDTSPSLTDGETLRAYSRRRLEEESTLVQSISYTRDYVDGLLPFSVVEMRLPEYGLEGEAKVMSQSMTFDDSNKGLLVSETAGIEFKGWVA